MNAHVNVLVVGAGPVGLTLACHLHRLGLSVRLIEKGAGPSVHSKAIGLQHRVSEVLARLGVIDRFLVQGTTPTDVSLYAGRKRLLQLHFVAPPGICGRGAFEPRAILIPQSQTEAILIEHLSAQGGVIEWKRELVSYRESASGIIAQVQGDEHLEDIAADWLVSCEGAHSVARQQAAIAFKGHTYPLAFFMADVTMDGALPHTDSHVWMHRDGRFAALPLPTPRTWRLFIEVTKQRDRLPQTMAPEDIRDVAAERAPGMEAVISGQPLWLSEFRISCRMVDRMRAGRVFLAGDAAHIHSPTGGQGITTGVQDAVNLAWKLERVTRGAPSKLLDTYNEERLPHAAEVLRETSRTTSLLFAPNPVLRVLRDRVVLPLLRSAWAQRRMFGSFSQLGAHYRRSSLSWDHGAWFERRIHAGDRAPDVSFTDRATANPVTLFDLMSSFRPVVLVNGVPNAADLCRRLRRLDLEAYAVVGTGTDYDTQAPILFDTHRDLATLYGLRKNFMCLIRPDGHVGLVQSPPHLKRFVTYLHQICDPDHVGRAFL